MKNAGAWMACALMAFALVMGWQALTLRYYTKFGPGSGFMPVWSSVLLFLLSAAYLWESLRRDVIRFRDILPEGKTLWRNVTILLAVLVFILIVPYTGFVAAGIVLLLAVFLFDFKWYAGLALSVTIILIFFYLFRTLLKVPLPVNALGW